MAFITACLPSTTRRLYRLLLALWLSLPGLLLAAEIEVANPLLAAGEEGYVVSADFSFEFNQRLEEAVNRGVILQFVGEFELSRSRWYWLDEKLLSRSQTYRLSYHALTRQYRLSTGGGLHQSFPTLSEALRLLSNLRNWLVVERSDKTVKAGETYLAAVRLRLDTTQLPRPFQIAALGNKDWSLASDWKTWSLSLPALPAVAVAPLAGPPAPAVEAK